MMNATFIQACELDDYHSQAPLHSASIALATLFAAVQSQHFRPGTAHLPVSGLDFLVAAIACFETGPRVGKAVYGTDMLTRGWHSGAVFGAPAAAVAASKLFDLSPEATEDAIGMACTQACGLMSAQYEGMVKRVQHGFASRNGLLGALLARGGYEGIKKVFERQYGGYLAMFSQGNGKKVQYKENEVVHQLGEYWHTCAIRIKLYACCGLTHGTVEAIENLQREHPHLFVSENIKNIQSISIDLSEATYAHCGWEPHERPMTSTGCQMCVPYVAATQIIDRQCLLKQFSEADRNLDRDEVWDVVDKIKCAHATEFDKPDHLSASRVVVKFQDGAKVQNLVNKPRGVGEPILNEMILEKYRTLAGSVVDEAKVAEIEDAVLNLESAGNVEHLIDLLATPTGRVLD